MEREVERQRQLDIERAKSRELQFNIDLEKEKQTQVRGAICSFNLTFAVGFGKYIVLQYILHSSIIKRNLALARI